MPDLIDLLSIQEKRGNLNGLKLRMWVMGLTT